MNSRQKLISSEKQTDSSCVPILSNSLLSTTSSIFSQAYGLRSLPTKLLSRNNPQVPFRVHSNMVYERASQSYISEQGKPPSVMPIDDFYGDRPKYLNMKSYQTCPTPFPQQHASGKDLEFDSCFECGNLWKAYKHKEREYILLVQPDTEAPSYSYWYYFKVKNNQLGDYKFYIINLSRPENLVAEGMRPAVWSCLSDSGWTKAGFDVLCSETNSFFLPYISGKNSNYYTLSFTYTFEHAKDTVYFAYSYPYTYTKLHTFLGQVERSHYNISVVTTLSKTLAGNDCECIAISEDIRLALNSSKQAIVLTGRVHPCETPSSFMVHGLLEFLLSDDPDAIKLRRMFVFYIVPMLNPDGVRLGNSRCSALGVDLNRRWGNPNRVFHPTVFFTKKLISDVSHNIEVAMYCDFHGHSKNKGTFMYGCQKWSVETSTNLRAAIVPEVMAQLCPSFSLENTHYKIEKPKEAAARIVVFKEFKIVNSYTVETSMHASPDSSTYTINDYKEIGAAFARACLGLKDEGALVKPVINKFKSIRKNCFSAASHLVSIAMTNLSYDKFRIRESFNASQNKNWKKGVVNKLNASAVVLPKRVSESMGRVSKQLIKIRSKKKIKLRAINKSMF